MAYDCGAFEYIVIPVEGEVPIPPRNYPENYPTLERVVVRDGSSMYFQQRGLVIGQDGVDYLEVRIDGMRIGTSALFQPYQLAACLLGPTVDYSNGFGAIL